MVKVERDGYLFIGVRAADSAKYYDIVMSHHYTGNILYLAWDACHKFGSRLVGNQIASYRDGIVHGENALAAAEYLDQKRDEAFSSLPEFNRSKNLKAIMAETMAFVEANYKVTLERL